MKYQTSLLRWASLFCFAAAVFCTGPSAWAADAKKLEQRADVVTIDTMAKDGKLELPPVTFMHDRHTEALKAAQKDCSSCHKPLTEGADGYSFDFMGSSAVSGDALKELYHSNCISCHATMKSGPTEAACRTCHNDAPAIENTWQDIKMDKAVHAAHVSSAQIAVEGEQKNCGTCHHVYDASAKKLVWGENKEDSCRACHLTQPEKAAALKKNAEAKDENGLFSTRPTLDAAAHQSCVNCHLSVSAKGQSVKSGPIDCAGCHSPAAQKAIADAKAQNTREVPRLMRGQADSVLMMPAKPEGKDLKGMMRPVSFDHKLHEAAISDCRTCHHKKIDSCSTCHSLAGKEEGSFVPLSKAMHSVSAKQSCIGCHNTEKQRPECAGCHTTAPLVPAHSACETCHSAPLSIDAAKAEDGSLLALTDEEKTLLSVATASTRQNKRPLPYAQADIPETVTIGTLSNEYEPSVLPHRKIVNKLQELLKDNKLAATFHGSDATLCQGCHHNSPASKTPPSCVSCHGVNMKPETGSLLSLKAAYHQQCMTCHARMNQKPLETECADCHKPRMK